MGLIDYQYLRLMNDTLKSEVSYTDKSRDVRCIHLPLAQFQVDVEEVPILTVKKVSLNNVVSELLWFLRGDTSIKSMINDGCNIWNDDVYNKQKDLIIDKSEWANGKDLDVFYDAGKTYPYQWRNPKYDQFKAIIEGMRDNIWSRRLVCNSWNPADIKDMCLFPCHYSWEIVPFSDDTFGLIWIQRSCDLALGIPYNILSYYLLGMIIEQLTGKKMYSLIGNLSNIHIYEPHLEGCKEMLTSEIHKAPTLVLSSMLKDICKSYRDGNLTLDEVINTITVDDFSLKGYKHSGVKKFELLTPTK